GEEGERGPVDAFFGVLAIERKASEEPFALKDFLHQVAAAMNADGDDHRRVDEGETEQRVALAGGQGPEGHSWTRGAVATRARRSSEPIVSLWPAIQAMLCGQGIFARYPDVRTPAITQ